MKIEYTLTTSQEILQNNAEAAKQTLDEFCKSYINSALDVVVNSIKDNQTSQIRTIFKDTVVLEKLAAIRPDKVVEMEAAIVAVKPSVGVIGEEEPIAEG